MRITTFCLLQDEAYRNTSVCLDRAIIGLSEKNSRVLAVSRATDRTKIDSL